MFSNYDYIMIALYFVFIFAVGIWFSKSNKNTSDYFRGGGSMCWWLTGSSVFMSTFSAWTFVACGGRIYKNGPLIAIGFLASGIAGVIMSFGIAAWYRRMRVVTAVDAIRIRYGKKTEQIFAWQAVVTQFIFSGVALYVLSLFLSPLLGIDLNQCVILVGVAVVFMSVAGGAWAVAASDFVQMLVLVIITVLTVVLILSMPEVGGISGFIDKLPDYQTNLTIKTRWPVLKIMLFANILSMFMGLFNLTGGAGRFLSVRSDADAKKASLMMGIGFIIGPFIWFLPPMAASFVIPDLSVSYGYLNNPEEAAYVAIAAKVLPQGMLGMLACGMFAATMSAMDTGLNRNSGIMVLNVYKPIFRPHASEKELLIVGKLTTCLFGVFMIAGGLIYPKLVTFNLFEWTQHLNALVFIPMSVPVAFGLLYRKDKAWVSWTCIIFCTLFAFLMKNQLDFYVIAKALGWGDLTRLEAVDMGTTLVGFAMLILGALWFLASPVLCGLMLGGAIFWATWAYLPLQGLFQLLTSTLIASTSTYLWMKYIRNISDNDEELAHRKSVDKFFQSIKKPVRGDSEQNRDADAMQSYKLGVISMIYGCFILLGFFIPNTFGGRLSFLASGAFLVGVGTLLYSHYRKLTSLQTENIQRTDIGELNQQKTAEN